MEHIPQRGVDYIGIEASIARLMNPETPWSVRRHNLDAEIKAHLESMRKMPAKTPEDLAANAYAKAFLTALEQAREALTAEIFEPHRRG
jgi:hypothetical protein